MLEYKWTRLLNEYVHEVTRYFFTFPISKEPYILKKKKNDEHDFSSYTLYRVLFIYKKLAAGDDAYFWLRAGQKFDFFVYTKELSLM